MTYLLRFPTQSILYISCEATKSVYSVDKYLYLNILRTYFVSSKTSSNNKNVAQNLIF